MASENFSKEMENYETLASESQSKFIPVPIVFREVKNARGKCFYLNAKNMLSTLEQQIQGKRTIFCQLWMINILI